MGRTCRVWVVGAAVAIAVAGIARADDPPPLAAAVGKADAAEVARLLDAGADPDATWSGYTALTFAAGTGQLAVVKLLVEHHATVDPKVANGYTPLTAAASNKRPEIVAYLIAHGAQVNVQGAGGWTPLDDAEGNHDAKTARILRAHGGVSGLPPLLGAANRGEVATVKKLLATGADPEGHDGNGTTALSIAANTGSLAIVKLLADRHASVDAASAAGWTPLMEAAMNGHADIVTYLIARGAKLDARNSDGDTALAVAERGKHADIAKLLRDAGATDAPPPPAPAPAPADDCADFRTYANQGPSGYASLVAGPAPAGSVMELAEQRPATISLGGSACTVSNDDRTLLCTWAGGAKNYDDATALARQCSPDSKIDTSPGKTIIWWGGVPAKCLIKIYVTGDDLSIKFFGG